MAAAAAGPVTLGVQEADGRPVKRSRYVRLVESSGKQRFENVSLSKQDIYQAMKKIVGLLESDSAQSTGFFVRKRKRTVFVSTFHSLQLQPLTTRISSHYQGDPVVLDEERAKFSQDYDIQLLDCYDSPDCGVHQDKHDFSYLPLAPDDFELAVGTTVYFAGYPLGERNLIFHKGRISSVGEENGVSTFTIDGTILPGHSGSPVVITSRDKKQLYLIGMIQSQAMDKKDVLDALSGHTDRDVQNIGNVIRSNLSTGIGRAIDIRKICRILLFNEPLPDVSGEFAKSTDMPVVREDQKPRSFRKDGQEYWVHCDNHRDHRAFCGDKEKTKRDIQRLTRYRQKSLFYSGENYPDLLEAAIKGWVDAGAQEPSVFTFDHPIGASEGQETNTVEIYYGKQLGSHMWPIPAP